MRQVTVHFNSTLPHFSQLFSGLEFLAAKKVINLSYHVDPGKFPVNLIKLEVNGKTVFFDLADNHGINLPLYNECDFYVKRMLLKRDYEQMAKLIPYGLYYPVYFPNRNLKFLFLKDLSYWKYSLKYWPVLSRVLNLKDSIGTNHLQRMSAKPADNKKVIFRCRLWDAGEHHPAWKRDLRKCLNDDRIKLNRLLGEKLGSDFSGGIRRDDFSITNCPDLVLDKKEFHRRNYLTVLRRFSIGIISPGLEESVGAKFGEYMAFGLAVVTGAVNQYQFLGPLEEGKHYIQYENPVECVGKTLSLHSNDNFRRNMQKANIQYYNEWLHPGVKLQKIFEQIEKK